MLDPGMKFLRFIRAEPELTLFQFEMYARKTPDIPNPTTPQRIVNAKSIEQRGMSDTRRFDFAVGDFLFEQWQWTEANEESIVDVFNGQASNGEAEDG